MGNLLPLLTVILNPNSSLSSCIVRKQVQHPNFCGGVIKLLIFKWCLFNYFSGKSRMQTVK